MLHTIFRIFVLRVLALDLRQNFDSAQYLENKLTDFIKIYICIHIDKIWPGINAFAPKEQMLHLP